MSKIGSSREAVEARARLRTDSGQVTMFLALMMGVFLVAFVGFATDYTTYWFQRQAIQGAADSTCQAAAMDLYRYTLNDQSPVMNFAPGANGVNCANAPTAAPCLIAKYNGYNASTAGVTVAMSFPLSVNGSTPAPGVAWPYVKVDITKQAPAYFSSLLTHLTNVNVHASATCGVVSGLGSGQILVLDPYPQITSFTESGGGTSIKIVGGAAVGIQVNSDSFRAAVLSGGATADLSHGGPNNTGSNFGVTGRESDPGTGVYERGSTGIWNAPDTPELNPFANLATPTKPMNGSGQFGNLVAYGVDGCPDHSAQCAEYTAGYYPQGITVAGGTTGIFQPGIYYMDGPLTVSGGSTARMAILGTHQPTDGLMFYFHLGTMNISGGNTTHTLDAMSSTILTCDGSAPPASFNIPSSLNGHVLVGQCTTKGTYYDAAGDTTDSVGTNRGLLFFEALSDTSLMPTLSGGSGTVYAGSQYFHNSSYTINLTISGGSTDAVNIVGNIVVDNLTVSGGSEIPMILSGGVFPRSAVAMIQ